ncbi:Bug family tripartite tricarboxylate transporter substrate binding protein [Rhodoferax sp.]|uniref:Bug family tripartite tricarboxylate transporter substrate binding protein n=1 Tax=Rhodoferax sp. TaxID=50421 RepID=UPI00374D7BA8
MSSFSFLSRAVGAAALALCSLAATAQDSKPIEWVLGYAPGGGSDVLARTLGEAMGKSLGQPILITNKPGAATNIAADYAAKARDTEHTLLTADFATLAANPALFAKLPYNAERDFVPVGLLGRFPMILVVGPNVPARNWKEFLVWAQANAGGTSYASAGMGSPHHLAVEMLGDTAKLKLTHVAYRGAAPAVQDVMGGQVPFMFIDSAVGYPFITAGKLKAIGVASPARIKTMAEIPTLAEQGLPNFEAWAWQGLVAPAAAKPETVARYSRALQDALASTAIKARFQALGVEAMPGTPAQMSSYVKTERERWGRLIRDNNIKLD